MAYHCKHPVNAGGTTIPARILVFPQSDRDYCRVDNLDELRDAGVSRITFDNGSIRSEVMLSDLRAGYFISYAPCRFSFRDDPDERQHRPYLLNDYGTVRAGDRPRLWQRKLAPRLLPN